jgi:hypothetical protein
MKRFFLLIAILSTLASCKKILEQAPQGVISDEDLNSPANIDKMVVAAYSALGNDYFTAPYSSLWPYGSVRGGDAYKGGDGAGDVGDFHSYETYSLNRVDLGQTDLLWFRLYVGIGRVNDALRRVAAADEAVYTSKKTRIAELRFLRGHFYFLSKILFKYVPYIDEKAPKTDYVNISNTTLTNDALWTKVADDFRAAVPDLPATQTEKGRVTIGAAKAYLAKTLLYQAYEQDENNNVTKINATRIAEVNSLCDEVMASVSPKYNLNGDYANNFLAQFENNPESVFAIQYSKDDATPKGRIDEGHKLNYPMNSEYGCCGFHVPSNDLVNAFKTGPDGLPMFNTYNDVNVAATGDYQTNTFDPRLDHTVAKVGFPFKYKKDFLFQKSWARAPEVYGAFASLKEAVLYNDASFLKTPPFMSSSKNWDIIRFDDVLMFKAEALIELGRQTEALPLINQLRTRAAASTALLTQQNGSPTSNYKVVTYQPGVNCTWTQDYARQALRWERRLEFGTEGYRFFDLVRWGIAAEAMNAYLTLEKTRKAHLKDGVFKKNRDEYLPIPLNQINFSKGLYQQNKGW